MSSAGKVRRQRGLRAGKRVLAVRACQVEAAGRRRRLQTPEIPSHPELVFAPDQTDLLVEVIRNIKLATIIHFAVLYTPGGQRVGSVELNPRHRVRVACDSGEAKLGGEAHLQWVIPDLPVAGVAERSVEQ